jgi:hypothetical protein
VNPKLYLCSMECKRKANIQKGRVNQQLYAFLLLTHSPLLLLLLFDMKDMWWSLDPVQHWCLLLLFLENQMKELKNISSDTANEIGRFCVFCLTVIFWTPESILFSNIFDFCLAFWRRPSHHLHDKQDDGKSFMPQESSGSDWYRGNSHVHLFTGSWDNTENYLSLIFRKINDFAHRFILDHKSVEFTILVVNFTILYS